MFKFLSKYGKCDLTIDGIEALDAFCMAHEMEEPYDLVCLDVMMPKVDGIRVLQAIREIERKNKISEEHICSVIIATALGNVTYVSNELKTNREIYVEKPISTEKLAMAIEKLR